MSKTQTLGPGPGPGGAFASVFSRSGVKPPKQPQQFAPSATARIPAIQSALDQHLRVLLGIGDETFVYGHDRWIPDLGQPFRSFYERCPPGDSIRQPTVIDQERQEEKEAQSPLWAQLGAWRRAVGAETVMRLLASVLNDLMTEFVTWSYSCVFRQGLHAHLEFWVEHLFSRIAYNALRHLDDRADADSVPETEVKKWKDMAVARLGALRVDELFAIIVDWDVTAPGIDDLRHFTTNPATRGYLTHDFANALQARLLHPGASTIEILQLYISMIRSFRILDPKGVLLDRVARKVRRYLREREDTIKVIVTGLLSDIEGAGRRSSNPDILTELALELSRHNDRDSGADDSEFDWNNMEWVPDPVDTAPDYLKSKNTDVIGSLITLFDTKDVFVKELQSTLAERLLKNKPDFNQEIGVLEHLKIRLGESALQGCEVMLRDVLDSRKVDNVVRRDRGMQDDKGRALDEDGVQLHAKILSRLFWPSMPEQSFHVPAAVEAQQRDYEKGFEALKQSRKLTWLNAIGQVEVELELEDRFFHDEVLPWQAAVIYAFQDDDGSNAQAEPVSKTVADIAEQLAMSPTLVRSACMFWVSKRILMETHSNTFRVLERLPSGSDTATDQASGGGGNGDTAATQRQNASSAAAAAAQAAAKEAEETERKQRMAMYHQFVVSMLTNQGAMPLARIAMMLGIVVPGGFPFGNEELKEFLAGMVREGTLEVGNAGVYKVAS